MLDLELVNLELIDLEVLGAIWLCLLSLELFDLLPSELNFIDLDSSHFVAERSGVQHSGLAHLLVERSGVQRSGLAHLVVERSGVQHSGLAHLLASDLEFNALELSRSTWL